jgi:YHS domain-containing protein/thiol-disulfide isomerase/thioredoxin
MFPRKRPLFAFALSLWFTCVCLGAAIADQGVSARQPETIIWRGDYAAALDEAKSTGRLLWIQFTGPWCPSCARMERDTFPSPAIVRHATQSFLPVKLRSDVYAQLGQQFNLSALPATIVVSPALEIIAMQQGYLGPAELDAFLSDALARSSVARPKRDAHSPGAAAASQPNSTEPEPAPTPAPRSKTEQDLALLGFCPVSLVRDRKLVRGQAKFTVEQDGRAYRFAARELAEEFRTAPERFVPRNEGVCPVSQVEAGKKLPGHPRWGVIYQDRLYLCSSAEARLQFVKSPERYAAVDISQASK